MSSANKPEGYFTRTRVEMLDYIPCDAQRILDVGCGEGAYGSLIKQSRKAEVWGAELYKAAANVARKRIDKVLTGDFLQQIYLLPDGYFDCIVFNDVLEHFVDPFSILSEIKAKLSRHGVVVCSVPNVRSFYVLKQLLVQKDWKYQDAGVLDRTHLRFFTEKSLTDMFDSLEYNLLLIKGIKSTPGWKFRLFNIVTFGFFADIQFSQFACVATPRREEAMSIHTYGRT